MSENRLTLKLLKDTYGICRLNKEAAIPEWAIGNEFLSITRTSDELSIVCIENSIPDYIKCEKDWRCLKIDGPLDFSLIGILACISSILAAKGVSIFAVSTYDTDYILVKSKDLPNTKEALSAVNHIII